MPRLRFQHALGRGSALGVAIGLLLSAPATAECARTYFPDQFRASVAALKKDRNSALQSLRGLAEEGFAPAQRRLGEALLADGQRGEALQWLRLAMLRGDVQAPDSYMAAKPTDEERTVLAAWTDAWTARNATCMEDFHARLRGGTPVSLKDFFGDFRLSQKITRSPEDLSRGMFRALFDLYRDDPSFLPYLRSVSVGYLAPQIVAADAVRLDDAFVVSIDEKALLTDDPARRKALMVTLKDAIRANVHDQAEPPKRINTTYKGRSIRAVGYADAEQMVDIIRKAIDASETLAPDLRKWAGMVKVLHYEAPGAGVDVKSSGTYVRDKGFIWFKRHPSRVSVAEIGAALVTNGVYAEAAANGGQLDPSLDLDRKALFHGQRARDNLR